MLAYPDIQILDVMGPLEVFSRTTRWLRDNGKRRDDAYSVEILGLRRGAFRASSGLRIYADRRFDEVGRGIDTLFIAGGTGSERYRQHPPLLRWIRRQASSVRRLASVCTGAFFLAEAGLLRGRRATTDRRSPAPGGNATRPCLWSCTVSASNGNAGRRASGKPHSARRALRRNRDDVC